MKKGVAVSPEASPFLRTAEAVFCRPYPVFADSNPSVGSEKLSDFRSLTLQAAGMHSLSISV